jgi:hypothetical protein
MASTQAAPTLEVVLFRAKDGVGDEQIVEAADGLQRDLEGMPGYLRRRLYKGEDGRWIDFVDWADLAQALAAVEAIGERPSAHRFMALVDMDSIEMLHVRPVRAYD